VRGIFSMARGIQLAALVVAALTIANTMFTAVLERRWQTGLQRALGMGRKDITRALTLEATAIGIVGGAGALIVGAGIGILMTRLMEAQYSWRVPFEPPLGLIVFAVIGATVISVLAGLLPTRLAVRTTIIESLRYE
jgi:putative ABC transport system permease protein